MHKKITKLGQSFFYLEACGSDYEIGRQIGSAIADDIADIWENFFLPRMVELYRTPPEKYEETYKWLRNNLEKVCPWMVEQIDGIAQGSGLEKEKIWFMNHYCVLWNAEGLFCTTTSIRDSDVGPLLSQNLDIGNEDIYYVIKTSPSGANTVLSEAMCAMCWSSTGVNDKGLAIGSSNLASQARKTIKPINNGISSHFIVKATLRQCDNTAEAVEFIKNLPQICPETSGYQMNIIDANGNMAVVDKSGPHCIVRQCQKDMNFTTNFSLDEELEKWRMEGANPKQCENYYMRAENIQSSYAGLNGEKPTVKWIKELFQSHEGIGRICRHGEEEYGSGYSRLGLVYYPCESKLEITNGWPCCNEYQQFSVSNSEK